MAETSISTGISAFFSSAASSAPIASSRASSSWAEAAAVGVAAGPLDLTPSLAALLALRGARPAPPAALPPRLPAAVFLVDVDLDVEVDFAERRVLVTYGNRSKGPEGLLRSLLWIWGRRRGGRPGRFGLAPPLLEAAHQRAQIARAQLIEPRLDGGRGAIQPACVLRIGGKLGFRIPITGMRRLPTASRPLLGGLLDPIRHPGRRLEDRPAQDASALAEH